MKQFSLFALVLVFLSSCSGFYSLKSSHSGGFGPFKGQAPYSSVEKYYGFISPSSKPDGIYKGKNAYYLYFWVPAAIDEVGIGMYSPSTDMPGGSDFTGPKFKESYNADKKSYFDTFVALERIAIIDAAKIKDGNGAGQLLGENDDTSEIPANPGGQKYNSVLRVKTDTSNPTKALVRSVYRITFTSFRGNVKGSFVAQVGTNIPGVKIASSLSELHKLVNETK